MEANKIYNMDCLEGLKELADRSVDLITTDPPYCVGTTSNGRRGTYMDNNLILPFFDLLLKEYLRLLKDGGALYVNTDWRTYPLLYPLFVKFFEVRNLIVWDYGWIKAGSHYRFRHEFIIYATKGDSKRAFAASEPDVWEMKPVNFTAKNKLHNAEKPVHLYERMILNSSREGDLVLDSFMGSGTTAVACINTSRNFVGFEIDENCFNIAQKRIDDHIRERAAFCSGNEVSRGILCE